MLKLKEIYALPIAPPPDCTPEPSHTTEHSWPDGSHRYTTTTLHYRYTARVVTVGEQLLEVTAYSYDGIPLWRTWQTGDRVIGQKMCSPPKAIEATIWYLKSYDNYCGDFFTDTDSEAAAMAWIKEHVYPVPTSGSYADGHRLSDTLDMIGYSQMSAKHKKRDEERNRIRREIDNSMLEIRETPKTFEARVLHDGFINFHYIIYRYEPKKSKLPGYCTRCRHEVTVTNPRNHKPGRCPHCHSDITYLSQKTLANCTYISHDCTAIYLQSTKAGFCVRTFSATMKFDKDTFFEPELKVFERRRNFYDIATNNFTRCFIWDVPYPNAVSAWCNSSTNYGSDKGYVYPDNLAGLFKQSAFKYIPMTAITKNLRKLPMETLLQKLKSDSAIEHLAKHGLWKLVYDRIDGRRCGWAEHWERSLNARDIRQAIGGVTMSDIRILQQVNPSSMQLSFYRTLRDRGPATLENAKACFALQFENVTQTIGELLKYTTLHRIIRYCREQIPNMPTEKKRNQAANSYIDVPCSASTVAKDWQDYLKDAMKLKWNVRDEFVLFPNNLREAHRQSIAATYEVTNPKKCKMFVKALDKHRQVEYKSGSLLIRLPVSAPEVQAEGKELHHCVGNYVDRVAKGETLILFIRRCDTPDIPFYTLELNPKTMTVAQVSGMGNCAATAEVQRFVDRWKKYLSEDKKKQPRKQQRLQVAV